MTTETVDSETCMHCGRTRAHHARSGVNIAILLCVGVGVQGERSFCAGPTRDDLIRMLNASRAMTINICSALGIEVPKHPRFDGGSGFAGGSAYEYRKQAEWDEAVREQVRRTRSGSGARR